MVDRPRNDIQKGGIGRLSSVLKDIIGTERDIDGCRLKLEELCEKLSRYFREQFSDLLDMDLCMEPPEDGESKLRLLIDKQDHRLIIEINGFEIDLTNINTPDQLLLIVENLDNIIDALNDILDERKKELSRLSRKLEKIEREIAGLEL